MRDLLAQLHTDQPADPMGAARANMRPDLPRRFYDKVAVGEHDGGFAVELDGRPARTPGKAIVALGTAPAARIVADEFGAQEETIDPSTMPAFRLVNTAIDGVAADPQAVHEDIVRFFGSDLVCYRAEGPETLVALQRDSWDGPLEWAERQAGGRFHLAEGVIHVAQPRETLRAMAALVAQVTDPVALAALHSMTTLTGSAVLAYGVYRAAWGADDAWAAAHVDEDFNIAQWGEDAQARAVRQRRRREMDAAARMIDALRT
ncbi:MULTISPECIES: ATP12 family protein [unclassified Roseitalea]|uniref:ATP12 family chaperone protein n=1 Tax=unclassified Roseitalea TaxID=2639107 RepID=UPI00273F851B|nr:MULTISPECIES: ATP12 family protein [unclassified Roseitalea]